MGQSKAWSRLDNAAKIFPPNSTRRNAKVFRLVCELTEQVDRAALQRAVDSTVDAFPLYRCVLKKGLFWYYLEQSDIVPEVAEEQLPVCSPLYNVDSHGLLFRVSYHGARINLEVFHALADGTGALRFLRAMVQRYLQIAHGLELSTDGEEPAFDEVGLDAFYQYYDKAGAIPKMDRSRAYRIRGDWYPQGVSVTEGFMSAKAVLAQAHAHGATLTEFLVAHLICSITEGMAVRERQHPVVISVPVDLRRFFPNDSARNFFGVMRVVFDAKDPETPFERVIECVHESFSRQLNKENMHGIIGRYSSIENQPFVKVIPLQVKIPVLRLAGLWSDRGDTAGLSNVGRIVMPESATKYVRLFDVFFSTKRPQVCMSSFGDRLSVSVSSPLVDTGVQRRLFRRLTQHGIEVEIVSNLAQLTGEGGSHAPV